MAEIINDLITAVTPLVVLGATATVTYLKKRIPDWLVVSLVVPLLSAGYALISNLIGDPDLIWWQQFAYGLIAVYVHQLYKKLKNTDEVIE